MTAWSRTRMTKRINNLAIGIGVETDFDSVFWLKNLKAIMTPSITKSHSVSMQGVGIVLGIVGSAVLAAV